MRTVKVRIKVAVLESLSLGSSLRHLCSACDTASLATQFAPFTSWLWRSHVQPRWVKVILRVTAMVMAADTGSAVLAVTVTVMGAVTDTVMLTGEAVVPLCLR